MERPDVDHGIAPASAAKLQRLFEQTPAIERVTLFGSRARGDHRPASDVDLVVDAPQMDERQWLRLQTQLEDLGLLYKVDLLRWQDDLSPALRDFIGREGRLFWAPRRQQADVSALAGTELKPFQQVVLDRLADYLAELDVQATQAARATAALSVMEGMEELQREAEDFPKKAWASLKKRQLLPPAFAHQAHSSRFDGAGRPIPNLCLKVPTGGGKTLLAAAAVGQVFSRRQRRHTGLVLWVVPNEAIYRQTLKTLSDRDHPYRQLLNLAGAGRVKVLEKNAPLSRMDVESHLCVMVLMLQSAARQSKETLRFFRDRGNVLGFLPPEDDVQAHWALLQQVPNLDVYAPWGTSAEEARATMGSIVKSSLGNVMRLVRPLVVIDEGHHAYTDNALRTLDGFNPSFMLELSATPRVASAKSSGSNILVDVRGSDLEAAEMIKLPIHVDVKRWADWQSCLAASVQQLEALQRSADELRAETARYIRPILLVQVERTGQDTRDAGYIHAEDARAHLLQLGFTDRQIAVKTAEKDELKSPENIDLLSPACEVRAIITKQALQEGWDCPFAYVLCALAAGRNPAAMTQLVGRILRQPQVAKTQRPDLDACYVLCHDARTADVVKMVKDALEQDGLGDLALAVRQPADEAATTRKLTLQRRPPLRGLRLLLPTVTWAEPGQARRELVYDSDVLARVDWQQLDVQALAADWAPTALAERPSHFVIDLSILSRPTAAPVAAAETPAAPLDRARLVQGLVDLAPNAWLAWDWVETVLQRLMAHGFSPDQLAGSSASLMERLRIDLEAERDRLAHAVFERCLHEGLIRFGLQADGTDYELPESVTLEVAGAPQPLLRDDARPMDKSLLEPALRGDMNEFEVRFAGYLDQQRALQWWHRLAARGAFGLQGWRRHKVYPDFVFAMTSREGRPLTVLMETKGAHLGGADTDYKRALLQRLSQAWQDERLTRAGELALVDRERTEVRCDLVFDAGWQGTLDQRYFAQPA